MFLSPSGQVIASCLLPPHLQTRYWKKKHTPNPRLIYLLSREATLVKSESHLGWHWLSALFSWVKDFTVNTDSFTWGLTSLFFFIFKSDPFIIFQVSGEMAGVPTVLPKSAACLRAFRSAWDLGFSTKSGSFSLFLTSVTCVKCGSKTHLNKTLDTMVFLLLPVRNLQGEGEGKI